MIVIPMVGKSSRFFAAGYSRPKYELFLHAHSMFAWSVSSFRNYFKTDMFLFLVRRDFSAAEYVREQVELLGISQFHIKVFDEDTLGQADTVFQGLQDVAGGADEALYIFNIDSFRLNFVKPEFAEKCDGFLEVFEGNGDHWSFVKPGEHGKVLFTTEKQRVSNLCSDGLYYFRHRVNFESAFLDALKNEKTIRGEYYVAPLYNYLIDAGMDIQYSCIERDRVFFCGTPDEYDDLINSMSEELDQCRFPV
jgi:hypothetical protein